MVTDKTNVINVHKISVFIDRPNKYSFKNYENAEHKWANLIKRAAKSLTQRYNTSTHKAEVGNCIATSKQ